MNYGHRDEILRLTRGGLDIFRFYLPDVKPRKNFHSPFYNDHKASCTLYHDQRGVWRYKDFGNGGSGGDAFWFVGELYSLDLRSQFRTILAHIVADLKLPIDLGQDVNQKPVARTKRRLHHLVSQETLPTTSVPSYTSEYSLVAQPFTATDIAYWGQYGITLETLAHYGVRSVASFSSYNRQGKPYQLHYSATEPIYCYEQGRSVKIYRPLSSGKFFNAGVRSRDYLFGYEQLPARGDCVLLTAGEKDVLSLASHGFPALCLNSETAHLPSALVVELSERFASVCVVYDMDDTGVRQSQQILSDHSDIANLYRIELPLAGTKEEKDVSDYFRLGGRADDLNRIIQNTTKKPSMEENVLLPFPSDYDDKLRVSSLDPSSTEVPLVLAKDKSIYEERSAYDIIESLPKEIPISQTPEGVATVRISKQAKQKLKHLVGIYAKGFERDLYLSSLPHLEEILKSSILLEEHRDRVKGADGLRLADSPSEPHMDKVQRLYGGVLISMNLGKTSYGGELTYCGLCRAKTTIHVFTKAGGSSHHGYEITEIELLAPKADRSQRESFQPLTHNSISLAKLLKDVELSYEPGVKLLDAMEASHEFALTGDYSKMVEIYNEARTERLSRMVADPLQRIRQAQEELSIELPDDRPEIVIPSSPVQERAQAILDARRGEAVTPKEADVSLEQKQHKPKL